MPRADCWVKREVAKSIRWEVVTKVGFSSSNPLLRKGRKRSLRRSIEVFTLQWLNSEIEM